MLCLGCRDAWVPVRRGWCPRCKPKQKRPRGITYRRCGRLWGVCRNTTTPTPHACHKAAGKKHECVCFRSGPHADDWNVFAKPPPGKLCANCKTMWAEDGTDFCRWHQPEEETR